MRLRLALILILLVLGLGAGEGATMAGGTYSIKLYSDTGTELETLTASPGIISLQYSILTGDVGVVEIVMPHTWATTNVFTGAEINLDYKIAVSRTAPGGAEVLENVYLLRAVELYDNEQGQFTKLIGVDGNHLLTRRYVDTPSTTVDTWSKKSSNADNVMKALVREALTDDADSWDRWIPATVGGTTYFTVDVDHNLGPGITDDYAFEELLYSIQKAAKTALAAGTPVFWRVVPVTVVKYTFYTYVGQIGTDRSATVTLGTAYNNMRNPHWRYDSVEEKTVIRSLGGNYGATNPDLRHGTLTEDTTREALSIWNRCEGTVSAYGTDDTSAKLNERGQAGLRERNPKRTFMCEIAENGSFRYGLHYFFGDKLTWTYRGQSGTAIVKSVVVHYDARGETIDAGLDIALANNPS